MANDDDKDILITPNVGATGFPNIQFKGYNADTDGDAITLNVLNDNTLSFESNQGQVFSINPILNTGTIFSVNDISGIASISVNADGTVAIAETGSPGKLGIGTTSPMNVMQVNVGTSSGAADGNNGVMIVNNDASLAADALIGGIGFDSVDGNVPSSVLESSVYVAAYAAEDHGTGDKGGYIAFGTADINQDDDTVTSERLRLTAAGDLGLGVTSPAARIEILQDNANNGFGLIVGADVSAASLTNDVRKFTRIGMQHYHTSEEPINLIVGDSDGTDNKVSFGGGTNQGNAATLLNFYAAANDATVTGTVQANITSSGLQIGSGARVTTINTSFSDNDTSLMTSQAIKEKITSYGYTTNTGDITGVDLTVTSPITISSETNTTSGSYSATLGLDDPINLTELTESTDATDDKILLWDESASSWKYMTLDNLQDSIDTTGGGGSGDITAVVAGTGLSGGATSGSATLNVDLKDEDDMSSDSATHAASQQSIKAYVDNQSPGTADFLIMEANTGAVNHTNDAGTEYNVNNTSYQFICFKNEQKKDAIYTHSTSSSSEEVTVTEAGTYMIFYSVRTDNLDDNRFVAEAAIHHQPSGGSYAERDYTRATSYSRGSGGSGVYDFDIQLNFAGALVLGAGDKIKLGVKQNDADDSSQTVRVQTDGTMLTMVRVAKTGNKASIIAATGATTLTNAQSGSVVYITGSGSVTLPSGMETGVQFVIINDTGGTETIGENGNTHVLGTHGTMAANTARTYVAVSTGNFAAIG